MKREEFLDTLKGLSLSQGLYSGVYNNVINLSEEKQTKLAERYEDFIDFILDIEKGLYGCRNSNNNT